MIPFSERLAEILKALNTSGGKFAETHGINRVSMGRFLNGQTSPGLETLEKICIADPRISTDFVLKGIGEPLVEEKATDAGQNVSLLLDLQQNINDLIANKVKSVMSPPSDGLPKLGSIGVFTIYESNSGYFFHYFTGSGKLLFVSDVHTSEHSCQIAIEEVKRVSKYSDFYKFTNEPSHFGFSIFGNAGQTLVQSAESYRTSAAREKVVTYIMALVGRSSVFDSKGNQL